MSKASGDSVEKGEVLVAILNNWRDYRILQDEGWYRIPVQSAPKRWPPRWLAFYQTKVFEDDRYTVRHYGEVQKIEVLPRAELFPDEMPNPKSSRLYYKLTLARVQERYEPLQSRRGRRLVFIPTTWQKFSLAGEFNDLFDDSPLEDLLWLQLKQHAIPAERQWPVEVKKKQYQLDFAIFCNQGSIDVETDGDTYHIGKEKGAKDNLRNNALEASGWHVLRFNTQHIQEEIMSYCVPKIADMIKRLGGQQDAPQAPVKFYNTSQGIITQPSLLESGATYMLDESDDNEDLLDEYL
jgi:very-short-patch-repair endonuclease